MISKEKLIEAMEHEIEFSRKAKMPHFTAGLVQALAVIKNQDEVETVDIVRCKECKFWVDYRKSTDQVKKCEKGGYAINENGYCAFGEKKSKQREQR